MRRAAAKPRSRRAMGRAVARVLVLTAAVAAAGVAQAQTQTQTQTYPNRPIRLILPYPPGGPTDIMGRMAADILIKAWGVQVVADNRPGFNGNIGAAMCAEAAPDGYTMCTVSGAQAVGPSIYKTIKFDGTRDFSHVTVLAALPMLLLVHPSLPVKTPADLVKLAKSKPGAMSYASTGVGVTPQLTMELFKQASGIDIVNVTYKGAAAALIDQVAGRVETAFSIAVGAIPFVKDGRLRAVGVSTRERFPPLPDVPTIHESGVRDFDASSWQAIAMPAGVPRDIVQRTSAALAEGLKSPQGRARVLDVGGLVVANTPEQFAAFFKAEAEKWARVARDSGIVAK